MKKFKDFEKLYDKKRENSLLPELGYDTKSNDLAIEIMRFNIEQTIDILKEYHQWINNKEEK